MKYGFVIGKYKTVPLGLQMSALTTRKQALDEIFSVGGEGQSAQFKQWINRHKNGQLSINLQESILKKKGYIMVQESLWSKKEPQPKSKK